MLENLVSVTVKPMMMLRRTTGETFSAKKNTIQVKPENSYKTDAFGVTVTLNAGVQLLMDFDIVKTADEVEVWWFACLTCTPFRQQE